MDSMKWRKAKRSSANGGDCVELAAMSNSIAVRDSKNPDGPTLVFTAREFGAFLAEAKRD